MLAVCLCLHSRVCVWVFVYVFAVSVDVCACIPRVCKYSLCRFMNVIQVGVLCVAFSRSVVCVPCVSVCMFMCVCVCFLPACLCSRQVKESADEASDV